jgi:DnaJ-class molecular chaperone
MSPPTPPCSCPRYQGTGMCPCVNPQCRACYGRGYYRSLFTPWRKRTCHSCSGLGLWLVSV